MNKDAKDSYIEPRLPPKSKPAFWQLVDQIAEEKAEGRSYWQSLDPVQKANRALVTWLAIAVIVLMFFNYGVFVGPPAYVLLLLGWIFPVYHYLVWFLQRRSASK